MEDVYLQSQELTEVPESIFERKVAKLNLEFNDIVTLPISFCEKLSNLTFLSLNGNLMKTLPSNIGKLTELKDLYLKENSITVLPQSIVELKNLQKLHITGNKIKMLPENIHLLEKLSELIADENVIQNLPSSFGNLKSLTQLNLSCNTIESLPDNFGNLRSLEDLDLSNNCLKSLPESFKLLPSLVVIDLNANSISYLPDTFLSAQSLRKLLVAQNRLSAIPKWFTEMRNIKEIFLSENDLHESPFPEDFGDNCEYLEQLDLSGNNLTSLPESIGKLKNLTFLDLGSSFDELERNRMISNGNDIVYLPKNFCDLKNLSKLELDENQIKELPENFGLLSNITYLDLSHNLLKFLPESFGQLQKLKVCMLSMNHMTHLPDSFGMLTAIEDLKLDNNMLEFLPESFENLTSIISLDLFNNNLKEPPQAVKKFKFLKSLDLRENDFGSTLDALAIAYEPTYPIRDPEQQDNWRGRKRPDIQPTSWVEKKTEGMNKEHLENDILYNAMVSASSLWRRHGQSDVRSKKLKSPVPKPDDLKRYPDDDISNSEGFVSKMSVTDESVSSENQSNYCNEGTNFQPSKNTLDSNCPEESYNHNISDPPNAVLDNENSGEEPLVEDTEYWDEDLLPNDLSKNSSISNEENDSVNDDFEESDWEAEIESHCPRNFTRTYKHPVSHFPTEVNALFIPSDLHLSSARGPEVWDTIADGQFDDADC